MSGWSQTLPSNKDCQKGVAPEDESDCHARPMRPDTGESNNWSEI